MKLVGIVEGQYYAHNDARQLRSYPDRNLERL